MFFIYFVELNEFVELFDYPFESHFEPMHNIYLLNSKDWYLNKQKKT